MKFAAVVAIAVHVIAVLGIVGVGVLIGALLL